MDNWLFPPLHVIPREWSSLRYVPERYKHCHKQKNRKVFSDHLIGVNQKIL